MSNTVKTRFTELANGHLSASAYDTPVARGIVERVATEVGKWADELAERLVDKGVELGADAADVRALLVEVGLSDGPMDEATSEPVVQDNDRLTAIERRLTAIETTAADARRRYGLA